MTTGKPGPFCPGSSRFAADRAYVQVLAKGAFVPFEVKRILVTYPSPRRTYITKAMFSSSRWNASRVPPSMPTRLTAFRASSAETP